MDTTHVLYHANCHDGFGAAWTAWTVLGDDAQYHTVQHNAGLPPVRKNSVVYLLDFCYKPKKLKELFARCKRLVILDHHKSARQDLARFADWLIEQDHTVHTVGLERDGHASHDASSTAPTTLIEYDEERSGATMTWQHFYPDTPIPKLLRYVEDRDLWDWRLPKSRAFSYALLTLDMDFEAWDSVVERGERAIEEMQLQGEAILQFVRQQVDRTCRYARMAYIGDHRVPCVNTTQFQSEIGERLLELYPDAPFAASFGVKPDGDRVYSLRSRGDFDVSEIARAYGGGGHQAAAGFKTSEAL